MTTIATAIGWEAAEASLALQPEMLRFFSQRFGPYPFTSYGAIVDDGPPSPPAAQEEQRDDQSDDSDDHQDQPDRSDRDARDRSVNGEIQDRANGDQEE